MLARSSALVLLSLAGGCDFVFGLSGQPDPCALASFDAATEQVIAEDISAFSVDWDQTFAVVEHRGLAWELSLPAAELTPIEIGLYAHVTFALAPEGNALLYTISTEPMELRGALRGSEAWQLDAAVPRGTFAGTPSADEFGPRRVLVRTRANETDVQEYVVDAGHWAPIGEPFRINATLAPNLTPNGLTMVWAGLDAEAMPGIFAASREDVDDAWGDPVLLRTGAYGAPQLCGKCQQLYAIGDNALRRFDR